MIKQQLFRCNDSLKASARILSPLLFSMALTACDDGATGRVVLVSPIRHPAQPIEQAAVDLSSNAHRLETNDDDRNPFTGDLYED